MIYLLFGPDTYRARQKVKEIIGAFREKMGDLSFHRIDFEEDGHETLSDLMGSVSLFQSKKLVVVENFFASKRGIPETWQKPTSYWKDSQDTIIIFLDAAVVPQKQKTLEHYKASAAKAQEFSPLAGAKLVQWVDRESARRNVKLASGEKKAILKTFGSDLWGISHELEKRALGGTFTKRFVSDEKIYHLADSLFFDARAASRILLSLLASGFDEAYIFGSLVWHVRRLLILKEKEKTPERSRAIESYLDLHPFVLKKLSRQAQLLQESFLQKKHHELLLADVAVKTGKGEVKQFLIEFCQGVAPTISSQAL